MCCADNVELAQLLLEAGAKPDAQNAQGQTALDVATSLDELERSSPWLDVFDTSQWLVHIGNRPTGRPRLIVVEQRVRPQDRGDHAKLPSVTQRGAFPAALSCTADTHLTQVIKVNDVIMRMNGKPTGHLHDKEITAMIGSLAAEERAFQICRPPAR